MHTTIAYSKAQNCDGAFLNIPAVPDPHIKTSGNYVYIGSYNHIIGGIACLGTVALEARLKSPSLYRVNPYYIAPVQIAIVPTDPVAMRFHPQNPVPLDMNEGLEAEGKQTDITPLQITMGVFLAPGALSPVSGPIYTLNFEAKVDTVVDNWAFAEITWPDALPVGQYNIVGARLIAAGSVLFRFVLVGEAHRPGGICVQDADDPDPRFQRFGGLGVWGSFHSVQPPGIELVSSADGAEATYQGYVDVVPR